MYLEIRCIKTMYLEFSGKLLMMFQLLIGIYIICFKYSLYKKKGTVI